METWGDGDFFATWEELIVYVVVGSRAVKAFAFNLPIRGEKGMPALRRAN